MITLATDFEKLMEYQSMLQRNIAKEQKVDKKIELLTVINQLTAGPRNLVQKEHLIIEATSRGFSEKEVEQLLAELKEDRIIFEPSPGYIKKK